MSGQWRALRNPGQAQVDAVIEAGDYLDLHADNGFVYYASGSATVHAYDSATIRASGSATVHASGVTTVHASGGATVHAHDSATIRASGSATVHASKRVAVHQHSSRAAITGGVVIDLTAGIPDEPLAWCEEYGLDVVDGIVMLFKGVDADYVSANGTGYQPGSTPSAPDWAPTRKCGQGLHFSPTPHHTHHYADTARYVACPIRVTEMICLGDKIKAERVEAPGCVEVDVAGRPISATKVTA